MSNSIFSSKAWGVPAGGAPQAKVSLDGKLAVKSRKRKVSMSKESVQFVEMIRHAAATAPNTHHNHYCVNCGRQTPHQIETRGRDEVYTCYVCGYQKWYTVG
jgi:RNase P subunit RPR2